MNATIAFVADVLAGIDALAAGARQANLPAATRLTGR
jgi:hypothetical protein